MFFDRFVDDHAYLRTKAEKVTFYLLIFLRLVVRPFLSVVIWIYYRCFSSLRNSKLPPVQNDLLLRSASSLADDIRTGSLSSEDVLDAYIARLNQVNPLINALVAERFTEARNECRAADQLVRDVQSGGAIAEEISKEKKPFLGVPYTVKECLMLTGMPYTSGILERVGIIADEDAEAVARVRRAGGIPIGVTNVPELCMWAETFNNVYGMTRNPYDLARTVGGSTGGEAAVIAAAGSPIGVGSDIGGSIRMPCMFNGIFGHKPTPGLVPLTGKYPVTHDHAAPFATVGPMCRYAEDLLPFFKVLVGDKASQLHLDDPVDISSLKVYYALNEGGSPLVSSVQLSIQRAVLDAVDHLRSECGCEVSPPETTAAVLDLMKYSKDIWMAAIVQDPHHNYCVDLVNGEGAMNPKEELMKFARRTSKHTLPAILLGVQEKQNVSEVQRMHFLGLRDRLRTSLSTLLQSNGVLVFPTYPTSAPLHYTALLAPANVVYSAIFNTLGMPSTHVPMGLDKKGLPIGIQVVSNQYCDHLSIAVANELAKAFGGSAEYIRIPEDGNKILKGVHRGRVLGQPQQDLRPPGKPVSDGNSETCGSL